MNTKEKTKPSTGRETTAKEEIQKMKIWIITTFAGVVVSAVFMTIAFFRLLAELRLLAG